MRSCGLQLGRGCERVRPGHGRVLVVDVRAMIVWLSMTLFCHLQCVVSDAKPSAAPAQRSAATAFVSTAAELQQAVRDSVTHIVVQDHIDMTSVDRWSHITGRDTVMDAAGLAIWRNQSGEYTASIRVRSSATRICVRLFKPRIH